MMKKLIAFLLCVIMLVPFCAVAEDGTETMIFDNEGNPIITLPGGQTTAILWGELELVLNAKSRPPFPVSNGVYDVYGVPCTTATGYLGTDDKYHLYITLEDALTGAEAAGLLAEAEQVESVKPRLPDYSDYLEHRPLKRGDVNMNGKRDAADYAMCKRAYLGNYEITDKSQFYCADVNGNGNIDTKDYAMIKRSYLGNYLIKFASVLEDDCEPMRCYLKDRFTRVNGLASDVNSDGKIDYTDIKAKREDIFVGIIVYGYGKDSDVFLTEVFDMKDKSNEENRLIVYRYGERTFALNSLAKVTDGERFYTVREAYDAGILTSLDLEDMCANFVISGVAVEETLK